MCVCAFCCRLLQGAEDAERYYVVALDVGRRGIVYGGQDGVVEYLCCCVRSGSTHSTLVQRPHAPAAMFFFFSCLSAYGMEEGHHSVSAGSAVLSDFGLIVFPHPE